MEHYKTSLKQAVEPKEELLDRTSDDISKEVVMRHLASFLDNNVDALLADYTGESVLITQEATYSGTEEIRTFFVDLNRHFPRQKSNLVLDKMVAHDDLVYIVWHAETPSLQVPVGSDTFIIKDGKIYRQTFAGRLNFINQ